MSDRQLPSHKSPFPNEILSQFARIRLIAMDLDGTLLLSNKSSLPFNVSSLAAKLNRPKYDVRTIIATGRTLNGSNTLIDKLVQGKDTPVILYNGAVIMAKNGEILSRKLLSREALCVLATMPARYPVKVIAYAIASDKVSPIEYAYGWSSIDRPRLDYNDMKISWLQQNDFDVFVQPSVVVLHYNNPAIVPHICKILDLLAGVVYTFGSNYIEICPREATKGRALEFVANALRLDRSQVLAMGDNNNDVTMLKWAGIGVAVGNASLKAKSSSDYIANFSVEVGAMEVLLLVREAIDLSSKSVSNMKTHNELAGSDHTSTAFPFILSHHTTHHLLTYEDVMSSISAESRYCLDPDTLALASQFGLLPKYCDSSGTEYFLNDDYFRLSGIGLSISKTVDRDKVWYSIRFGNGHTITGVSRDCFKVPAFIPSLVNLMSYSSIISDYSGESSLTFEFLCNSTLHTHSLDLLHFAFRQANRINMSDAEQLNAYLNPPQYMGSKRALCSFLVESISSILSSDGIIVDLMCGSGVASNAFSKFWTTYASDAQEFCQYLASIQGSGFDSASADGALTTIMRCFYLHFETLKSLIPASIDEETEILCSEANDILRTRYDLFIKDFPTIANNLASNDWNPASEVENRVFAQNRYPYCLFTSYFSNSYFGVRQSLEIDSLRFAIDQLDNAYVKKWALGALVSSVSCNGTTYGGHFAQPKVKNVRSISKKALSDLLVTRSRSIVHDFVSRFLSISASSESKSLPVHTVDGPWENSLNLLGNVLPSSNVVVYLDPPYTREEYSRYYHVLETLVKYNYPSCSGSGLTPHPIERFSSKFFTRDSNAVCNVLHDIISRVLSLGWSCAWSYSNTASANIVNVIKSVSSQHSCNIKSFSTPAVHKSHGGAKHKDVVEFLVIFVPSE